jgi:hypothetical protein
MNRHVKHLGIGFYSPPMQINSFASGIHYVDAASELTDMFPCGYVDLPASASYARPVFKASCIIED